MCRLLSSFFLFIYLMGMVAPFAPLVEYYANYTYIKENLCEKKDEPESDCCGKCYLKKQIVKEEKKEAQQPLEIKEGKNTDIHLTSSDKENSTFPQIQKPLRIEISEALLAATFQPDKPPPRSQV